METSGPRRYITDGPALPQQALRLAPLVVVYFLAREVAFLFPASDQVLSAVWPASGIALASLLISPRRLWPAILAALFLAGSVGNLLAGRPLADSLGFATASILEALACSALIVGWCGREVRFTRTKEVTALAVGATVVNACTACLGAATAAVGEAIPFWRFWLDWWVSNGLGILLVTPFVLAWLELPDKPSAWRWGRVAEWTSFMAVWVAMAATAFHHANSFLEPQPYMLTALIAWPALRFGRRTVTLAFVTLAVFSVTAEAVRVGSLRPEPGPHMTPILAVQVFLALTLVAALLLTASRAETTSAERSAREGHDRVRAIGDNLPSSMVYEAVREPDGTTRFLHVSAGCEAVNGVPAEAVLAEASVFYGLIVEADRARVLAAEAASAAAMSRLQIDARFHRPDGELRWMHLGATPQRLADGRVLWDGIETDVTERVRSEDLQRALYEISEATNQAADLPSLFAAIHAVVGRLMDAANLYIALYDAATDTITFPYYVDEKDEPPPPRRPGRGLTEFILRTRAPLLAGPDGFDDLVGRGEVQPFGTPAADRVGVPLLSGDRPIGVLVAQSYRGTARYGEREKEILTFVSRQIALAIERRQGVEALQASEIRYRTLFESASDGIVVIDAASGRVEHVNPSLCGLIGYPAEALLGRALWELAPFHAVAASEAAFAKLRAEEVVRHENVALGTRDGGTVAVEFVGNTYLVDHTRVVQCNVRDVTERRRAEELQSAMYELSEAAHQSGSLDQLYARIHSIVRRLMEARNLYVALYDPATDLIRFPYFVDEVDRAPEPLPPGRGMTGYVLRTGNPLLATPEVLAGLQERGEIEPLGAASVDWLGVPLIVGDQTIGVLAVQSYTEGVRYGEREKGILTFVSRQVALAIERKRSEEALRDSEERYRTVFEQSPVGLYQTTPDGRVAAANPALLRMLGFGSFAEIAGRNLEAVAGESGAERAGTREALDRDGAVWGLESAWRTRDGTVVFVRENARAVRGGDGALLCYEGTVEDITRWRAVKEEHRRLTAAIEQAAETIVITDTEGRIQYVNPAFEKITGYTREEAIGQKPSVLKSGRHDQAFYEDLWRTIMRGETWQGHFVNRRKDGSVYEEDATISPIRDPAGAVVNFVAVKRDVTQEVALEAQLRQAQKMEAIGNLAGGVAHDFNNLLQVMLSQIQLLRSRPTAPERAADLVRRLEEEIQHGAALTRQLLLFSRRETAKRERVDLNAAIVEVTQVLGRLVRANIELALELAPEPVFVDADRGELQQVLMNLTLNASDAMPDGGRLAIRIGAVGDGEVCVAVEDTGHGIPEEFVERVFEPFFTTKEAGKGTGLGLSVVHGIVTRMGGRVEVESEVGRGSTFRVVLTRAPHGAGATPGIPPRVPEPAPGRGERILVVEDEEGAREGLRELLSTLGYEAVAVGSGEEAAGLPQDPPFDLLLTDLMLPGATGTRVAAALRARWPRLQVVLMSGYTEDEVVRREVSGGAVRFLQKPFGMATLASEVRAALDERPDAGRA